MSTKELFHSLLQKEHHLSEKMAFAEVISLLMLENGQELYRSLKPNVRTLLRETQERLAEQEIDFAHQAIESRYAWIESVKLKAVKSTRNEENQARFWWRRGLLANSERVDRVVMHPIFGYLLFFIVMAHSPLRFLHT